MKSLQKPAFNRRTGLIPRWLIYTGCGCVLLIVLAIGGLYFGGRYINEKYIQPGLDAEVNWPKLQEILPFDQRPAGTELQFTIEIAGVQLFILAQGSLQVMVIHLPEAEGKGTKDALTDPSSYKGFMGMGERRNAEKFAITIQGVERNGMRFIQDGVRGANGNQVGASAILDMSKEGTLRPLLVQLTRTDGSEEPLTDDEIHRFFEAYRVGQR